MNVSGMKMKELIESGVQIEGYRKIQCWYNENAPDILYEGENFLGLRDDNGVLKDLDFLDQEVAYIFPYMENCCGYGKCTPAVCYELAVDERNDDDENERVS